MSIDYKELTAHLECLSLPSNRTNLTTSVIPTLIHSISKIAQTLRSPSAQKVNAIGSSNAFGDEQLNVDVLAEQIIRDDMTQCPSIATASSEEDPTERTVQSSHSTTSGGDESYTIAFDPLDGSSIIAPNWTVGTIIGIWDGHTALNRAPDSHLLAAILGVYGPRTTAIVALRIPGCKPTVFELGLSQNDHDPTSIVISLIRPVVNFLPPPFSTRYFAPANLRAASEDARYAKLISHFIGARYTLRYSGGLVPDVVHALVKGHGLYVSPVTEGSKAKLRRLYELTPVALVVECAGGEAVEPGSGERVLARAVGDCDERGGLVCGTGEEVRLVLEMLGRGG